ncbi:MAG: flagellar basal-body MS-ring/collar protein FliF [Candidatus Sphingomonas phytovorans]|nr:flagellar basal-body MS-ring/collar protein FliF [Sphingomonas sp.]WEJ98152.1 MAG: flagellar basal-body MS-ring/collar protein FliF [Sphingomonas sp.]
MTTETATPRAFTNQRRIAVVAFVAICLALFAGYYLFLRTDYVVLYTGLKQSDASVIVAELKAKGVSHRLRDNGTTILVPTAQADDVRLSVAGSEIPMKGAVGFELFNKSDMGLTDFAQKINYQRALQGELARTIMMMEGVESARVHLAIPERSLFRGNRSTPKAAIEVIAKPGQQLTAERVAGIQQLVASAVPDLPLGEVVVLDGDGHIVSQAPASQAIASPEVEEQVAAQNYYSARAKAAMAGVLPGLNVGVRTLVLGGGDAGTVGTVPGSASAPSARNFRLRVTVLTLSPLEAGDQDRARAAVATAIGLDEAIGDSLSFEVGPITQPAAAPQPVLPAAVPATVVDPVTPVTALDFGGLFSWWSLALAALVAATAVTLVVRNRQGALSVEDRDAFVGRLRAQLAGDRGDDGR